MNTEKMYQEYFLQMLKGKAEYQASEGCDSPSANYFWYRKRRKVLELLQNNLETIQNSSKNSENSKVLIELGCGEATDLFLIYHRLKKVSDHWKIIGLEGDPYYSEICQFKKKTYNIGNELEFQSFDLTEPLPFKNESVDFVYCSEVIEHIPNPEDLLVEIKRIIKPEGCFLMTTPNEPNVLQRSYWDKTRNQKNQGYLKSIKPEVKVVNGKEVKIYGHISLKTNSQWDNILKQLGFDLVDYERGSLFYGGIPFYDHKLTLGLALIVQFFLDMLPKQLVRDFSDELIALYKKST